MAYFDILDSYLSDTASNASAEEPVQWHTPPPIPTRPCPPPPIPFTTRPPFSFLLLLRLLPSFYIPVLVPPLPTSPTSRIRISSLPPPPSTPPRWLVWVWISRGNDLTELMISSPPSTWVGGCLYVCTRFRARLARSQMDQMNDVCVYICSRMCVMYDVFGEVG